MNFIIKLIQRGTDQVTRPCNHQIGVKWVKKESDHFRLRNGNHPRFAKNTLWLNVAMRHTSKWAG